MLPMSVHGRVSDIWRAVILNRLCEMYGLRVAVTSGTVQHPHGVPVVNDWSCCLCTLKVGVQLEPHRRH